MAGAITKDGRDSSHVPRDSMTPISCASPQYMAIPAMVQTAFQPTFLEQISLKSPQLVMHNMEIPIDAVTGMVRLPFIHLNRGFGTNWPTMDGISKTAIQTPMIVNVRFCSLLNFSGLSMDASFSLTFQPLLITNITANAAAKNRI